MTATWNFSLTETSYRYESPPPPCSAVDNKPASSPLVVHNNPAQSFWAASVSLPKHTNHSTPAVLFTWVVTKPHASQGLGKGGNVRQWHRTLCSLQEWTIMPRVVAQMPCQQLKREKKMFFSSWVQKRQSTVVGGVWWQAAVLRMAVKRQRKGLARGRRKDVFKDLPPAN